MKLIYLYLLIITPNIYCQNNSGVIIYKAYLPSDYIVSDTTKVDKNISDEIKKMFEAVKKLEFELKFNTSSSSFNIVKKMNQNNDRGEVLANTFYGNIEYYFNREKNYFIRKRQNNFIKINDSINWNLLNEVKFVNGYECYKATYEYTFLNRKGIEAKRDITAWYCPKIPVNVAPENYNGLPGLVLELNTGKIIYVAKELNFFDDEIKIDFPKGKILSEEEYSKKLNENSILHQK